MKLMDGWLTIEVCPNCNGEQLLFHNRVFTAPYLQVEFCNGSFPLVTMTVYVKCKSCGLVIQSPRMTDERIDYYYSSGAYRQTLGMSVEDMDADELRRARDVAGWLRAAGIAPASHLDIGASRGYLCAEVGASVQHGTDTNKDYGGDTAGAINKHELVTAIHVLEHATDPLREIALYKSLSTDKILIEVPGENTKGGALRFAHLYYFPPATLINMLKSAGLEILKIETEPNTRILCGKIALDN